MIRSETHYLLAKAWMLISLRPQTRRDEVKRQSEISTVRPEEQWGQWNSTDRGPEEQWGQWNSTVRPEEQWGQWNSTVRPEEQWEQYWQRTRVTVRTEDQRTFCLSALRLCTQMGARMAFIPKLLLQIFSGYLDKLKATWRLSQENYLALCWTFLYHRLQTDVQEVDRQSSYQQNHLVFSLTWHNWGKIDWLSVSTSIWCLIWALFYL